MSFYLLLFLLLSSLISLKGVNRCINEKSLSVHAFELAVTGEGEDYFQSLFGDPKKSLTQAFQPEKAWKHFAMILKEVSQSRSRYIFYLNYLISPIGLEAINQ